MLTRDAIALGRSALHLMAGRTDHIETKREIQAAAKRLGEILAQMGCEENDPTVTDGRLTTYIDVLING